MDNLMKAVYEKTHTMESFQPQEDRVHPGKMMAWRGLEAQY